MTVWTLNVTFNELLPGALLFFQKLGAYVFSLLVFHKT